ncbi:MAG TPA: alcohol dehydrogenase catalytic domain-containing protein [Gaiellaceae bacterium]|nr:alcohol dehydrogenase catalytic domain-containing protein [Gaiellaceae bacterium]
MRAVVLDADGLPELADLPEPSGAGLLVRVVACGLCGSDVEKLGRATRGTVLGHEVAGVLENGARVTVMHRVPCGTCERCLAGYQSTCGEFRELRITPGGFAEQLRATHCVPLPDTIGGLDGIWAEPLACVLRAAEAVPPGRVLVVGAGAIGQLWIQVLRRRGDDVVAVDPRPERLATAHMLGAETGDNDTVNAAVLTAPAGINDALHRLEPGGTLLVFAAPEENVPTTLDAVYRKELHVVGSRSATPAYFRSAVELLPTLVLPEVTTLPLDRFLQGVELYRRGDALKVVFTP